jgi:hypothetical protein
MEKFARRYFSGIVDRDFVESRVIDSDKQFVPSVAVEIGTEERMGLHDVPEIQRVPLGGVFLRNFLVEFDLRPFEEFEIFRRISADFVEKSFSVVASELKAWNVRSERPEIGKFLAFLVSYLENFPVLGNSVLVSVVGIDCERGFGLSVLA